MNELEAINMLLRLIGSSPVNSKSTPHPDVANARTTLDRIRNQAQRRGWWFNIAYNVYMEPNDRGEVVIPDTWTTVVLDDRALVKRGNKVFHTVNRTFLFQDKVLAKRIVEILDWDDMPGIMQEYCAYFAGSQFVRDELEDPQKSASLDQSAAQTLIDVRKQDLEEGQYNMFDKQRVRQARGGVMPYARSNKRFYGDPDV